MHIPLQARPSASARNRTTSRTIAVMLALWLLLPTFAGLWTSRHAPETAFNAFGVTMLAIGLLAMPLVLLGSARALFMFWMPIALLAPVQLYLIYFFGSVPGDALTKAAMQLGAAETIELLAGLGWMVLLLPLSWIGYVLLWRRIDPALRLSGQARKALAACLLMYAAVGLLGEQELGRYVTLPPMLNLALASATYPAGNVVSLMRVREAAQAGSSPTVPTNATAPDEAKLVILVIGETIRPDHLGINGYARNTTPELARLGTALMSFSDVASTTNHTAGAVPNLVRRVVPGGAVSLVSMFRDAGFNTSWFSNQQRTVYEPHADLSDFSHAGWHEKMRQDADLLPMLASCIKQCGRRQLIVLHMYGSHFPYDERYGRRDQLFEPVFRDVGLSAAAPRFKRELINSYDNSLLGTDRFLASVIAHAAAADKAAMVLFTSDHGENLYDDERNMFMHAGPNPTRRDTMVPLLFWANNAFANAHAGKIAAMRAQVAAPINHLAVMPTLLDLAGIRYDGENPAQSLASGRFKPGARMVEGSETGSSPIDFEHLR
jgi:glucan phosphoethanolaminetransferase (alkaline phosphatase superfamily)